MLVVKSSLENLKTNFAASTVKVSHRFHFQMVIHGDLVMDFILCKLVDLLAVAKL